MRTTSAAWTWSGAGVTGAFVSAGLLLGAVSGDVRDVLAFAPVALAFAVVGSAVLSGRPRHRVGVLFVGTGVAVALLTTAEQLALAALSWSWSEEVIAWIAWLAVWPIELTVGLVVAAFLLFPDGRLPSPRWRPALLVLVSCTSFGAALSALSAVNFDTRRWEVRPPVQLLPVESASELFAVYQAASLVLMAFAALSLVQRWRSGDDVLRRQVAWVAAGAVVTVVAVLFTFPLGVEPSTATRLLLPCIPLAAGVAMLQRRLYDIEGSAARTLLYGTVSGLLLVGCLLAALTSGRLVGGTLVAVGVAASVVLVLEPLRRRLQTRLNALLLGSPDLPSLAGGLCSPRSGDSAELLRQLTAQLAAQLGCSYVAVEFDEERPGTLVGDERSSVGRADRVPLVHGGERVGTLVLSRPRGRWLRQGQHRALSSVLPYVALVVAAAQISCERDAARRQVVSVREEERVRLRRLLHDTAGGLSGIALQLDVAADGATPPRSQQLQRLQRELAEIAQTVRALAYEMGPSVLADVDLVEALSRALGALPSRPERPWQVEVRGPAPLTPLPPAVAVAAYRITVEAVNNAYRHSRGHRCTVDVEVGADLRLVVADDGCGLPEPWYPGVGVATMRERADELGGAVRLASSPGGGAVLELRLPLQREGA